jgi:hypothetical protein
MTPDQIRRAAYLLEAIGEIDDWIGSLGPPERQRDGAADYSFDKYPKVVVEFYLADAAGQNQLGWEADDRVAFDRQHVLDGLKHIRQLCLEELNAPPLGIALDDMPTPSA